MKLALDFIFAACWVFFLLYWVLTARSVKPTQEKRTMGNLWRVVVVAIVGFLFFEGFGLPVSLYPFNVPLAFHPEILGAGGAILTSVGLIVALLGRRRLGENWSASDKAVFKKGHELVTTGVYGYVRHPIYFGFLLMFLGDALFAHNLSAAILFIFVLVSLCFSLKREEELLIKHFPGEYPVYKKRVRTLIPFIW